MPRMSDTMEEGNIVAWLVEEGESVEPGQTLAEVETDKATMELDSYFEGTLLHIAVKEGAVPIDGVIAVIGEEGEDWKAAVEAADTGEGASQESEPAEVVQESSAGAAGYGKGEATDDRSADNGGQTVSSHTAPASAPATPARTTTDASPSEGDGRVKASPLARAMAREAGIDLASVNGSGENGRVVKRDIEQAKQTPAQPATPPNGRPAPAAAPSPNVDVDEVKSTVPAFAFNAGGDNFEQTPVSQMRKAVSRLVGKSKFTAPHFYVTVEIDMGKVWKLRKQLNEVAPVKISFNDLVIKACAVNLPKHPAINSSWQEDHIRVNKDINIAVAVAIPDGLMMPVVRYANLKSLSQINTEVKELVQRAKNRKISQEDMSGNTFSISNLGMFGIEEFTAIINPPDACILAVGGIIEKAIVRDGVVVPGKMMKVTLSCDHRVVDGALAAQFLNDVKATLEDPMRLMV